MKIEGKDNYKVKKDLLWRKVDKEIVIVQSDVSEYCSLNETASEIWELLNKGESVDIVVKQVVEKYDIAEDKVRKDVAEFINKCLKEKLIEKRT